MVVQKDHLGVWDGGVLIDRSIDQIMLFPITRAREGTYKDPNTVGSVHRRSPLRPLLDLQMGWFRRSHHCIWGAQVVYIGPKRGPKGSIQGIRARDLGS